MQESDKAMGFSRWDRVKELFDKAVERPPDERAAFLDEACDDPDVRVEVETLLEADQNAPSFLEGGAGKAGRPLIQDEDDGTGRQIGPYRLVEPIGRGGMGVVYRAERADGAFEHEVAVKFLPRYFETGARVARFRAERQILADLNHPNIARLLDGGVTEEGTPYLVMEYVEGESITHYADRHDLSVEERLALLQTVLTAVQVAHANLVVHRDLKPSNILVTEDGQVKLLDFGIAKLLDTEDASWTLPRTHTGQQPMTPEYAAPEQVTGGSITTATDTYQIGVLAYELLTGERPFDLADKRPSEMEQIVAEEMPTKPSTALRQPSSHRATSRPQAWAQRLRGDLDTIILKALRKEPERRYTSAEAIADDIQRYLAQRPIEARPATWAYRSKKFVRRHRWSVLATAAVAMVGLIFIGALVMQRNIALDERDRAEYEAEKAERVTQFLTDLLEAEMPDEAQGEEVTVQQVVDRGTERIDEEMADQPELQATLYMTTGKVYRSLGDLEAADSLLYRATTLADMLTGASADEVHAEGLRELGQLRSSQAELEEAETLLRQSLALQRSLHDDDHEEIAIGLVDVAELLRQQGKYDEAEPLYHEALDMYERLYEEPSESVGVTLSNTGLMYHESGRYADAKQYYQDAFDEFHAAGAEMSTGTAAVMHNLAGLWRGTGRYLQADTLFQSAVELDREMLGDDHHLTATSLGNLGMTYRLRGKLDEADTVLQEAVDILEARFPAHHPSLILRMRNRLLVLIDQGRYDEADDLLGEIQTRRDARSEDDSLRVYHRYRAISEHQQGQYDRAEMSARAAIEHSEADDNSASVARNRALLRDILIAQGQHDEARQVAEQVLEIGTDSEDGPTVRTMRDRLGLIQVLRKKESWEEAADHVATADSAIGDIFSSDGRFAALLNQEQVLIAHAQGRTEEAVERLEDVLDWKQKHYTADHPNRAHTQRHLGSVLVEAGEREAGSDYLRRAHDVLDDREPWAAAGIEELLASL